MPRSTAVSGAKNPVFERVYRRCGGSAWFSTRKRDVFAEASYSGGVGYSSSRGAALAGYELEEGFGGVAESSSGWPHEVDFAFYLEFRDADGEQTAFGDFLFHAHAGQEGDANVLFHHPADGFDGGHFHVHVKADASFVEGADYVLAVGREDVVGDEDFVAEFGDGDVLPLGETVLRGDDEGEGILVDDVAENALVVRLVADDAEFQIAVDQFAGDAAGEAAADLHLNFWVDAAVALNVLEEVEGGGFVGTDDEASGRMVAQFGEGVGEFAFEVLETAGVFEHTSAGVGQHDVFGGPVEEFFAQFSFESLERERHGRLGAPELLRRARKAALVNDGHEYAEGTEFHVSMITDNYEIWGEDKCSKYPRRRDRCPE